MSHTDKHGHTHTHAHTHTHTHAKLYVTQPQPNTCMSLHFIYASVHVCVCLNNLYLTLLFPVRSLNLPSSDFNCFTLFAAFTLATKRDSNQQPLPLIFIENSLFSVRSRLASSLHSSDLKGSFVVQLTERNKQVNNLTI